MPSIISLDVDLGRIHAFSNRDGRVCYNATDFPWAALSTHDITLVEVASAIDTSKNSGQAYNRRKWTVGNCLQAGRLWFWFETKPKLTLLASSADKWTLGHNEKMRNVVANTASQDNHDIRSCREMLFYFNTNPDKWVPMGTYYENLRKKAIAK